MITLYSRLDSTQHEVINTKPELWHWLRRQFPQERLFLYRHRKEGVFVIAQWVADQVFCEVMHVGRTLSEFTREKADHLRFLFSEGNSRKELARRIKETYDYRIGLQQAKADAESDRIQRKLSTAVSVAV